MQISFLSEVGKVGPVETRPAVIREGLEWELERAQAWIDNAPKPYPKDAAWGAYFADEHIKNIPQLLAAAESGDLWAAVGYALRIGYNDGRWHMYPQRVKETRRAKALEPDAAYGAERRNMSEKGGRAKRKTPPDDVLQSELDKLVSSGAHSKTRAREVLAKQFGVSYRTILRHTT